MGFAELLTAGDRNARRFLGGPVIYTPGTGSPVTVNGIFDAAYVRVDAGTPGIASQGPAVFLTLAELPTDPKTDRAATVTVAGVVYTPYLVQPDGLGGTLLHLHLV